MTKQTAMMYFVLDSKSERPRIRIENGAVYPDGTWHSWCEQELMPPESFFQVVAEYWNNREIAT